MNKLFKPIVLIMALALLALSACSLPIAAAPTQGAPNLIYTAAAETVIAQITQASSGADQPGETPQPPSATSTQGQAPASPTPTNTTAPTTAVPPTKTSAPPTATPEPATSTPVPCNQMAFIKDVNYPDDTVVDPGTTFEKTWRLKNTGSCTWNSDYVLIFDHGDAMGASASVLLTDGKVHPGDTIDATVPDLVAPSSAGTYQGFWKLRDGSGHIFGYGSSNKAFWVKIEVNNPVNYDFIDKAHKATWSNTHGTVTFGAAFSDKGLADVYENVQLENGKTFDEALATYPERVEDGNITGVYTNYTVQKGDHFRSKVGFKYNCSVGDVKFQLSYQEGDTITLLKSWSKECDGSLLSLDYDLSALKGHTVQFILGVDTNGPYLHDNVLWTNPRIQQ